MPAQRPARSPRRLTLPRSRVLAALAAVGLVAAGVGVATTLAATGVTVPPAPAVMVSWSATRSPAVPLDGLTLGATGDAYVFVAAPSGPVDLWFDRATTRPPSRTEQNAPFDLRGTADDGTAKPLPLSTLTVGRHTVTAAWTVAGVRTTTSATFTVDLSASWATSTTAAPATTPPATTSSAAATTSTSPAPPATTSSATTPATTATTPPTSTTSAAPAPSTSGTAPAPSSTTTRTSVPAGTPLTLVGSIPEGWPNLVTTGVPAGTVLRDTGGFTVTTPGAVISGLDVAGCITVAANDVTITRTRIRCARDTAPAIRVAKGYSGLLVTDTEIDGMGMTQHAVGYGGFTLRRVNVHDVYDGIRLGSNTTVEDSYVHDLVRLPGVHNDTLQTTGAENVVVRHNTLLPYNSQADDPMNSAFMLGTETSPKLRNVLFEDNWVDGGNYTINVRSDVTGVSDVVFRNNRFGRHFRYGPFLAPTMTGITFDRATNTYADGTPVR